MSDIAFPSLPHQIKGYHVEALIGTGGSGEIYRARQAHVDREVAMKVVNRAWANQPIFIKRFEVEAQLVARLEHPFIVPLYDYWRSPDGAYLVMRLLSQGNLREDLDKNGPWDVFAVQQMLHQIGDALTLAHSKGIVHRDIKPQNILLDHNRNCYLTDFGIALRIDEPLSDEDRQFASYGTPVYSPPEQYTGGQVSVQGDVYSLATVIFEALSRKQPFQADTNREIIRKQMQQPFPSLLSWLGDDAHQLLPLDEVLRRATAKHPSRRYDSMAAFIAAFDAAIQNLSGGKSRQASVSIDTVQSSPLIPDTMLLDPENMETQVFETNDTANTIHLVTTPLTANEAPDVYNPYKGLVAFGEADAHDFFGREVQITGLLDRLQIMQADPALSRLLCLVGASGSGKSSLARAGLVPEVRNGVLPGDWYVTLMNPGKSPLRNLGEALQRVAMHPFPELESTLATTGDGLVAAVEVMLPTDANLLLVIDQLEEVFTQATPDECQRFLALVAAATKKPGARVFVTCTLRADYYEQALSEPTFAETLQAATELVLPLTEAGILRVIQEPAHTAGLNVDAHLAAALAMEASNIKSSLPLLQFTLSALFERRQGNQLDYETYQQMGGVTGALARHADTIMDRLSPEDQKRARRLLFRLTALPRNGRPVRRRVSRYELLEAFEDDQQAIERLLDVFYRGRLLTYDRDPHTRQPTVEIAHEALLTGWNRLAAWIEAEQDTLNTYQRLQAAVQEWEQAARNTSFLASGVRLIELEGLKQSLFVTLSPSEQAFLNESREQRRQVAQRRQMVIVALATAAGIALVLALTALMQWRAALRESDRANTLAAVAQSRELAARAQVALDSQPRLALENSLAAFQFADTVEARNALFTNLQQHPFLVAYDDLGAPVTGVAVDGETRAAARADGRITVWSGNGMTRTWAAHDGRVNALALSGSVLVSAGTDGRVRLWDPATGAELRTPLEHEGAVWSVALHPDGEHLASGDNTGSVRVWDVNTGTLQQQWSAHVGAVFRVVYSPSGETLASGGEDQQLNVYVSGTDAPPRQLGRHENWVLAVAYTPNGQFIATSGAEPVVRIWDINTGSLVLELPTTHNNWIRDMVFNNDGRLLSTASQDGTVRLWDMTTGTAALPPLAAHSEAVWDVAQSTTGTELYTAGGDGLFVTWDLTRASPLLLQNHAYDGEVLVVAFAPDGSQVLLVRDVGTETRLDLIDTANGEITHNWDITGIVLVSLALNQDSSLAAGYSSSGNLYVWDLVSGEIVYRQRMENPDAGTALAWLLDGQTLLTTTTGNLQRLDVTTQTAEVLLTDLPRVDTLAVLPGGQQVALGTRAGDIILTSLAHDDSPKSLSGHTDSITHLHYLDATTLISAGRDATVRVWQTDSSQAPLVLREHQDWVLGVTGTAEDRLIATGGRDRQLILWDAASGRMLGQPITFPGRVLAVHTTPTGDLLTVTRDGQVSRWVGDLDGWRSVATAMLR